MSDIETKLSDMGIELPEAPAPAAAYLPFVETGNLLFTAGQIATDHGQFMATGIVEDTVDLATAQACARQCAINIISQTQAALGELERVRRIIKLTVFVASTVDFKDQHLVANGASNFLAEVFGEAGRHARSAVGVPTLPLDSPVEIEAVIEIAG